MKCTVRIVFALVGLAACSSAPSAEGGQEALFAERQARNAEIAARQTDLNRVLTDLDKLIDRYVQAVFSSGYSRADDYATKVEGHIRQMVSGLPSDGEEVRRANFDRLVRTADQVDYPRNRAIALSALGFAVGEELRTEALNPLINACVDENREVVESAVFGLAILQHRATPIQPIADVMSNDGYPEEMRAGAAWTLYRLQLAREDERDIFAVWLETLAKPLEAVPGGVAVSALRGIGLSRNPEHWTIVAPWVGHPQPLVRQATAIALGRLENRAAHEPLLTLISLAEPNENVRLTARKALQALAGGRDLKYDVEEWRRIFDDGPDKEARGSR